LCDLEMDDIDVLPGKKTSAKQDFAVLQEIWLLEQSHWLVSSMVHQPLKHAPTMTKGVQDLPIPTKELLKNWMQTIKDQEQAITHNCWNAQESMTLTSGKYCRHGTRDSCSSALPDHRL